MKKVLAILVLCVCSSSLKAAVRTWDTTIAADGIIDDGYGTWTVGAGNWNNGTTSVGVNWVDGNQAFFGTTSSGGSNCVVTLGSNVRTTTGRDAVRFNGSPHTFTLDLAGFTLKTGSIGIAGATPNTGAARVQNGTVELSANQVWSVTDGPLTVAAQITGSFGIRKFGAGHITLLNTNNSFTGALDCNNSGNITISSIKNSGVNSCAGAGNIIKISNNADLHYNGSGDTTDRTLQVGNGGSIIYSKGSGPLVFAGSFANVNNNTSAKTLTLRGANKGANEIQGAIIDSTVNLNPLNLAKTDAGSWILSGTNTYSGNTSVNAGMLILADGGETRFVIGTTGVSNQLKGDTTPGSVTVNGAFRFDLTGASTGLGDSWNIVSAALLSKVTFGSTFTALSTVGSFTKSGALWSIYENGAQYQFSESTGVLSVIPPGGTIILVM